jgi:predicted acyl esterase
MFMPNEISSALQPRNAPASAFARARIASTARPVAYGAPRFADASFNAFAIACPTSSGTWVPPGASKNAKSERREVKRSRAASAEKWLEVHGGSHWAPFYTDYGVALQKRFFDHFLKGEDNGWQRQPKVQLNVRHPGERFVRRHENEWPLARTKWTPLHLALAARRLDTEAVQAAEAVEYAAMGEGLTFITPPLEVATEITGPVALKLFVSSATTDADIFAVLRVFAPGGAEVVFQGALDPHTPVGQGWLRASHRKLDPTLSTPWRPYHSHDELQPLVPGEVVELDIEIIPTSIVVPVGYRIALSIRGRDYEYEGEAATLSNMKHPMRGCGPFLHDDPSDRPPEVFGGRVTLHSTPGRSPYLLLPVIPANEEAPAR